MRVFFSQERCHAVKNSEEKNRQVQRKDEAKNTSEVEAIQNNNREERESPLIAKNKQN